MKKLVFLVLSVVTMMIMSCSKDNSDEIYPLQDDKDIHMLPPTTGEKAIKFLNQKYNDMEYCVLSFELDCGGTAIINGKYELDFVNYVIFKRGKKYPITFRNFKCESLSYRRVIMINGVREDGYPEYEIQERLLRGLKEKTIDGKKVVYGYIDLTNY
ncbi:hypothetical protein [Capnocytophaga cynodegmi]|uniref:hypothetical protein n=1 Tax=Capnocytophaga cynodegmi TaxID=28189 RepID=UPI001BB3B14A|nr:hypothetical protein [Capnocytophaga cynodegmi]